ncbi:MAG: PHP domain-containing protein, partial [Bradymonadaceae bacterium]
MLIDIHAKSSISRDDNPSPRTVLERARDAQLDGVAFCEHQSTVYSERILQAADDLGVEAFVGVEIPTDTGLLLGFAPEIDEFYHGEYWRRLTEVTVPSPQAIVDMFRERGGAVVAARPYDRSVAHPMGDNVFEIDGLDAVEAANS